MDKKTRSMFFLLIWAAVSLSAQDQYASNPLTFSVAEMPGNMADHFLAADLDNDGDLDFCFRSATTVYAYDHDGSYMWSVAVTLEAGINGTSLGAADVDGDGATEVLVLDDSDNVIILNGSTGNEENRFATSPGDHQRTSHLQIVNLRGEGDRDVIVQTLDEDVEGVSHYYYINRSLIAFRLDTQAELWRVVQDTIGSSGATWYEGYWGQAHGSFLAADIDGDGLDEVAGATWVDDDGTVNSIGYPTAWIATNTENTYMDHLDAIVLGDFRPDAPGLEWAMTEEGHEGQLWYTRLLKQSGGFWQSEIDIFSLPNNNKEPQNLAVGNFNSTDAAVEFWNRSRFSSASTHDYGTGQHPWVYDSTGALLGHYDTGDQLDLLSAANGSKPFGDNHESGIEEIWTIDWDGSGQEYIAGKSRHATDLGHVGIFNGLTGEAVWSSLAYKDSIHAVALYVADLAGDSREEVVVLDAHDNTIKIFHNEDSFTDVNPNKWDDALYRRLKQNWSYYSPGSYTAREPVPLTLKVFLEGPYNSTADAMNTDLKDNGFLPAASPYVEDNRVLPSVDDIPANVVDWVLVELRASASGPAVYSQAAFLRNDGRIIDENGNSNINAFVESQASYYIVIKHRNHLDIMTAAAVDFSGGSVSYDFTTGTAQAYGNDLALLESGVYGMYGGDGDGNNAVVFAAEVSAVRAYNLNAGYISSDTNLDGAVVFASEITLVRKNNLLGSNVN